MTCEHGHIYLYYRGAVVCSKCGAPAPRCSVRDCQTRRGTPGLVHADGQCWFHFQQGPRRQRPTQ